MNRVRIKDKEFVPFLPEAELQQAIANVAAQINKDFEGKEVLFLGVLNGSFLFAADLFRRLTLTCSISFVKLSSYHGTSSTGKVNTLLGLSDELKGKHVVVVEDIVDTGNTIEHLHSLITSMEPASLSIATLLLKPDVYKKSIPINYVALKIPNDFVVGFGLDYDGLGRNLPSIYKLA